MDDAEKRATLDPDSVCIPCRAGMHNECDLSFTDMLEDDQECCCRGDFHYGLYKDLDANLEKILNNAAAADAVHTEVNYGYLRPEDAPGLTKDIDALVDALSTGRKMADRIQKELEGQHLKCEWAGLRNAGGGVEPIVGCIGNPASALHHGPDKNTLNNRRLPGEPDCNLHWICPDCHNRWHAKNDKYYDARPTHDIVDAKTGETRTVVDASVPFTPVRGISRYHDPVTTVPEAELFQIELRRREEAASGRKQSDPQFGVELERGDSGTDRPAGEPDPRAEGDGAVTEPEPERTDGSDPAADGGSEPGAGEPPRRRPRGFEGHIGGGDAE